MDNIYQKDLMEWIGEAPTKELGEFRKAVHTILTAISTSDTLRPSMILKGGILLAIRYSSGRFTKDLDFSTDKTLSDQFSVQSVVDELNASLLQSVEELPYGLDCRVQSARKIPNRDDATFPSIKMTIGYATQATAAHKRLLAGHAPKTISIDYSLNEPLPNIDGITLNEGEEDLMTYSLIDLIAEKIRSLLQQESRNRGRRQDIYDIYMLVDKVAEIDADEKLQILSSLLIKSRSRDIEPEKNSFENPVLKSKALKDYDTLADEVEGVLPDFDKAFDVVQKFYTSLPWEVKAHI